MSFGMNLKNIRLSKNMSQDKMATLLKTTKQVISRYENGQRIPKIDTVIKYCKILNVPITYFTNEDETKSSIDIGLLMQNENISEISPEEEILIKNYRLLDNKDKTLIQSTLKSMIVTKDDDNLPMIARNYDMSKLISLKKETFSNVIKDVKFVENDDDF